MDVYQELKYRDITPVVIDGEEYIRIQDSGKLINQASAEQIRRIQAENSIERYQEALLIYRELSTELAVSLDGVANNIKNTAAVQNIVQAAFINFKKFEIKAADLAKRYGDNK